MVQREGKILEHYLETFLYNLQCIRKNKINPVMKEILFLKGVTKESMDMLNLMGGGDISTFTFNEIVDVLGDTLVDEGEQ